ncbi:hypothetical protein AAC387_Pa02g2928 [Persea americana]
MQTIPDSLPRKTTGTENPSPDSPSAALAATPDSGKTRNQCAYLPSRSAKSKWATQTELARTELCSGRRKQRESITVGRGESEKTTTVQIGC